MRMPDYLAPVSYTHLIERGVNYPTFDTLEKIMDVLGVTPNELLSGEWKYVNQDVYKRQIMNKILILVMEPLCSTRIFF